MTKTDISTIHPKLRTVFGEICWFPPFYTQLRINCTSKPFDLQKPEASGHPRLGINNTSV